MAHECITLLPLPFAMLVVTSKEDFDALPNNPFEGDWAREPTWLGCVMTRRHEETRKDWIVMCLPKVRLQKMSRLQIGKVLVHESVHVWQTIRDWSGEWSPGREIEAYYIDHIFSEAARSAFGWE